MTDQPRRDRWRDNEYSAWEDQDAQAREIEAGVDPTEVQPEEDQPGTAGGRIPEAEVRVMDLLGSLPPGSEGYLRDLMTARILFTRAVDDIDDVLTGKVADWPPTMSGTAKTYDRAMARLMMGEHYVEALTGGSREDYRAQIAGAVKALMPEYDPTRYVWVVTYNDGYSPGSVPEAILSAASAEAAKREAETFLAEHRAQGYDQSTGEVLWGEPVSKVYTAVGRVRREGRITTVFYIEQMEVKG